jgi:outer membrane protein
MFVLLLGLLSPSALAGTLDLERGTHLAAEQSNLAATAALAVRQQEIDLQQAGVAWTPDVDLGLGSQVSVGRTFSEQLGSNVTEPNTALFSSLAASMPLYQGGELRAERDQAQAELRVSQATQEQTLYDLRWWVADMLLQIAQARSAVAVQQAALQAEQDLLAQVAVQVEAGARTLADRHAQQAVVSSRQASLAAAAQTLADAELSVLSTLRLDPDDAWTFVPPPALDALTDTLALVARADEDRPDLRAARQSIEASAASEPAARADFLPSVSLGAGASTSLLSSNPDAFADQLDTQARAWGAVELSFRILDGGVRRASVSSARLDVQEAELSLRGLGDEVELAVRQLLARQHAGVAYLEAATTGAEAAQQAVDVLTLRYQSGSETLVSVTEARASLVEAELDAVQARFAVQRVR